MRGGREVGKRTEEGGGRRVEVGERRDEGGGRRAVILGRARGD